MKVYEDGRGDSPGHSGKYITFSIMDDATNQITLFDLIQVKHRNTQKNPVIYLHCTVLSFLCNQAKHSKMQQNGKQLVLSRDTTICVQS